MVCGQNLIHFSRTSISVLAVVAFMIFANSALAGGPAQQTLYRFQGNDGAYPVGKLLMDRTGNIFGTTPSGGPLAEGVVFKLTPPRHGGLWRETVIQARLGSGAAGPYGGLISDQAGNLYGTTLGGGRLGMGTVFALSPPKKDGGRWKLTVLYSFKGGMDGYRPYGPVVFDRKGSIYGTTSIGGGAAVCVDGCGTVFQLVPPAKKGGPWTEHVLHRFQGVKDGATPVAGLAIDSLGNLFGTTINGGRLDGGTGLEARPVGPPAGWPDSHEPRAFLVLPTDTNGTVFEVSPPSTKDGKWKEQILHRFAYTDGANPYGGLILDARGNLYGTTTYGGNQGCALGGTCGLVFQLEPPTKQGKQWTERVLFKFPSGSAGGANPYAGVTFDAKGNLYGTTTNGGFTQYPRCNYGCGAVYKLTPSGGAWTEQVLYEFKGHRDGSDPGGDLMLDSKGVLYGTSQGDTPDSPTNGTVFRIVR